MYRLAREEFLEPKFVALWSLLGFQAGFINSFGFLAGGRFVSHVTGFGTQIGLAIPQAGILLSIEILLIPLFFILGAFVSGIFTSARLDRNLAPHYWKVTLAMPLILSTLSILTFSNTFGEFGTHIWDQNKFSLIFCLAFLGGMQNGCFATMTKGQIRTTHLTGISTDLGTDFARTLFGKLDSLEKDLVWRANFSRLATFASFALGAVVSVLITQKLNFLALVIPTITSLTVFIIVQNVSRLVDQSTQNKPAISRFKLRFNKSTPMPSSIKRATNDAIHLS